MNIVIIILVLCVIVFLHELGHFLAAKLFRVPVATFAIGFPPTLFSWKRKETTYKINLLPLGGYVNLTDPDNPDAGYDTGLYRAPWGHQAIILLGGIIANIITAFLVIWMMVVFGTKTPSAVGTVEITGISQNSAVVDILEPGDTVKRIGIQSTNLEVVDESADIVRVVSESNGNPLTVEVLRGGATRTFEITPQRIDGAYKLGISMTTYQALKQPIGTAFVTGLDTTRSILADTAHALGSLVSGLFGRDADVLSSVSGPVGLVSEGSKMVARSPWVASLNIFVLLSLNLALFNFLPIPSLDGGQIIIATIRSLSSSRAARITTEALSVIGAAFMLLLIIGITLKDVIGLVAH
jgi:regulator of sigma E protease